MYLLAGSEGNPLVLLGIVVLTFVFMYFVSIRPQRKRQKEHQELLNSIDVGAEVLLNGGIIGRVTKVKKDSELVTVQIDDKVNIITNRGFIVQRLPQGTIEAFNKD